jgi:hypothetical protein
MTSSPSTSIGDPARLRDATWSTALARSREIDQQTHRGFVDAVLRIVEEQIVELEGEAIKTIRIGREKLAHVDLADLSVVRLERLPRRSLGQRSSVTNCAVNLGIEKHREASSVVTRISYKGRPAIRLYGLTAKRSGSALASSIAGAVWPWLGGWGNP